MAQNEYEVQVKVGLEQGLEVIDKQMEKIDAQLLKLQKRASEGFEESVKGKSLTPAEKFSARYTYMSENYSGVKKVQNLRTKKEELTQQKKNALELSQGLKDVQSGQGEETAAAFIQKRINTIKKLDSLLSKYTDEITGFKGVIEKVEKIKAKKAEGEAKEAVATVPFTKEEKKAKKKAVEAFKQQISQKGLTDAEKAAAIESFSKNYDTKRHKTPNQSSSTKKTDYIAKMKAARVTDEQIQAAKAELERNFVQSQKGTASEKPTKIQQEKSKRVQDLLSYIKKQAENSSLSEEAYKELLPRIEGDVATYVDKTHAGGEKKLARRKRRARGFEEGFVKNDKGVYVDAQGKEVKGTKTSVLRAKAFEPFITKEGEYVSSVQKDGSISKTVAVYDPSLANPKNIGGVGDLRNTSLTRLEEVYSSLTSQAETLKANGQEGTTDYQEIVQLIKTIPEAIKRAYDNSSNQNVKDLFAQSLTNSKFESGLEPAEIDALPLKGNFARSSALSDILRDTLRLQGKATRLQPNDYGWDDTQANNKTDQTDTARIRQDAIKEAQAATVTQAEKDRQWEAIKSTTKEDAPDYDNTIAFLERLKGNADDLREAIALLAEQIIQTAGIDIDRTQRMGEVIAKSSLDRHFSGSDGDSRESLGDFVTKGEEDTDSEEWEEKQRTKRSTRSMDEYIAKEEEKRANWAGGMPEAYQRLQSAVASSKTSSTLTDEAVAQARERILWLADVAEQVGAIEESKSLKTLSTGFPVFGGMDADTIGNSISQILSYPEALDASLSHNYETMSESRAAQGLRPIKESTFRNKFFKENPEIAQKYQESLEAKSRFDSVESDNMDEKLQAFFNVTGQIESGTNKFIAGLSKSYSNLADLISRVKTDKEGEESRVEMSGKEWVQDIVAYRTDKSGNALNPNAGINTGYYLKEGIVGEDVEWGAHGAPEDYSPALVTNLQYKAGLTGNYYGGKTPQENAAIAESILEKKRQELAELEELAKAPKDARTEKKTLKKIKEVQAEIDFHYKNWDELRLAQTSKVFTPKQKNKSDATDSQTASVTQTVDPAKALQDQVRQTGLSVGASFSAQNKAQGAFNGTIQNITGTGKGTVVEALLEDGRTVKYTLEGLINQLVAYSTQATQTVENVSEQAKNNVVDDVDTVKTAVDQATSDQNQQPQEDKQPKKKTRNKRASNKTAKPTPVSDAKTASDSEAENVGDTMSEEKTAVDATNQSLDKHESDVLSAAEAEKQKVVVSKQLIETLAKEQSNFKAAGASAQEAQTQVTKSVEQIQKEQEGVTYEYANVAKYDDETHTYTDENRGTYRSLTTLAGALKGSKYTDADRADEKAFMAAIKSKKGDLLTADDVGMTEADFAYKKKGVIAREKGNLEHEVIDLLSKTGFQGLEGLRGKTVETKWGDTVKQVDAEKEYQRVLSEKVQILKSLGVEDAEETLKQSIESYAEAVSKAKIQLTPFSETPMAVKFSGQKGDFSYSLTPDQIARSADGTQNYILDTKTGKTVGTESFQLAGELYAILANANNPKFQPLYQKSGIDTNNDFSLYIADVKDTFTQLIQHMALSEEEFYELLARAHDIMNGNAEPLTADEQKRLMNREMATGRVFGGTPPVPQGKTKNDGVTVSNGFVSYAPSEAGEIDKREQNTINAYVAEYQKLIAAQTQLNNLKKQQEILAQRGVGYTSEESQMLVKQIEQQNKVVEAQQKVMNQKGLVTSDVDGKVAIGNVLLSDKRSADLAVLKTRAEELGGAREAKNDTSITTTENTERTKSLGLSIQRYKELLTLQNQLKESQLKENGLQGEKLTAQQNETANFQAKIQEVQRLLQVENSVTAAKTAQEQLEKDIAEATYLTTAEKEKQLNDIRTATNEAQKTSLGLDTKYAQSPKQNNPNVNNLMSGYFKNLEEQGKLDREITRAQQQGLSLTGTAAIENKAFVNSLRAQKTSLANQFNYDEQKKTLNGVELTEEQINRIEAERTRILKTNQLEMEKVGVSANKARGFFTQLKDSFKQSFSQMGSQIMQLFSFYQIRQVFMQYISAVEQLDQKMVDLQIASGYTRKEIKGMMADFNELAEEIGKTTQEVAAAANDWLRAGYSGKQAADLTEASMQLSTLGMIESSEATSYLISVLKGWKLEASEVQGVVDKLTAVDMAAAISAGDLAEAMSRASNSAQMAGSTLDRYIAYLTTITDVTQKSAASVGESMKTVYSRYQNIAAGKFEAAQADIESENYNEEDWANLNDVERALGALGVEIRSSVDNFREFDDVAEEIASKWNTYTDVQKSGIATALAGTRQRENVLTLFENWDAVEKFEEISSTAYGTAVKKMEAYTDSVEAAKNRVSIALEKWVLALNQSSVLTGFYNTVASVADNLAAWGAAILLATAMTNLVGLSTSFHTIWNKLITSLASLSTNMQAVNTRFYGYFGSGLHDSLDSTGGYNSYNISRGAGRRSLKQTLSQNFNDSFLVAQKENYAKSLTNAINGMDELTLGQKDLLKNGLIPVQNVMLSFEAETKKNIASIMFNTQINEQEAAMQLEELLRDKNRAWVENMLATMDQQELNQRRQELRDSRMTNQAEIDLRIATQELAKMRKSAAGQTLAGDLGGSTQTSAKTAAISGALTLLGGGAGTLGGYAVGKYALDNDNLAPLLSLIVGSIGSASGASISSVIGNSQEKGIISAFKAMGLLKSLPLRIGLITTIVTTVVGIYSWIKQKKLEEAQEAAKTAIENYQQAVPLAATAKKYDELSSGVDSLGRNVSLSDEDYEKFLEYSNALSEVFPQLTTRTDESGNAIFYMGDALSGATEKVEELTEALEMLANYKMVMGEEGELVLGNALKETAETYQEAQETRDEATRESGNASIKLKNKQKELSDAKRKLDSELLDSELQKAQYEYDVVTALLNGAATEQELISKTSREAVDSYYANNIYGYSSFDDINIDWVTGATAFRGTKDRLDSAQNKRDGYKELSGEERKKAEKRIEVLEGEVAELEIQYGTTNLKTTTIEDAAENEMTAARLEIAEYGKAYANVLGAYQGVDDTQQMILDSAIEQVEGAKKENGEWVKLSESEYKEAVSEMVAAAQQITSDEKAVTLIEAASEKTSDSMTVEDANKARNQLLDYLKTEFPNIEEDENMMKVIVGLGFEVVDGEIVDNNNILNKFKDELGISEKNGYKISLENLEQLKVEDAKQIYQWLKDGTLSKDDNMMLAVQLLRSSREMPKGDWDVMEEFMMEKSLNYGDLESKMESYFTSDKYKEGRVSEIFADYDEQTRTAIEQIQKNLQEGIYEVGSEEYNEALEDICAQGLSTLLSYGDEYAEAWVRLYYPESIEIDGYINTFEELQTALKETAQCYQDLADAQEEQAENGKLSLATVLDLLTTNANYISLLEFEKETLTDANGTEYEHIKAIKLKDNAEEEMAKMQLISAKASAIQTIQTLQNTKAQLLNRAEAIKQILLGRRLTESNFAEADSEYAQAEARTEVAQQTTVASKALNVYAGFIAGVSNMISHLANGGELSTITQAYKSAYNAVQTKVDEVTSDYASKRLGNQQALEEWKTFYEEWSNEELIAEYKSIMRQTDPAGNVIEGQLAMTDAQIDVWKYYYQNVGLDNIKDWLTSEKFVEASDEAKDSILDLLEALDALIDKEWEAMKVFDEENLKTTGYTEYFEKKRESLEALAAYYESQMNDTSLTEKERLDAEKNYIENQKALNNLDDEEIEDKYKILELYGVSIKSLKAMKEEYIKTADTQEELLERQKEMNELIVQEIELRKEVAEWQQKLSDKQIEYVKGTAWSNSSAYDSAMEDAMSQIDEQIESTKSLIEHYYREAVRGYLSEGMTMEEARAEVAKGSSENSESYRQAQETYLDLLDSKTEYVVNRTSAQIDELSNKLQLLEDSKPKEWTKISDIESYYASRSALLQSQVEVYEKALEDVSDLTDDQIKEIVDGLNEATVALHEAKISALEDKTELQEKQYDAIVYRINLYKEELQDAIDAIEDAYEDEVKDLENANKERERAVELENLLLAKKNASKEKERVYQAGIGWTYQSNPTKLREAQKNLDDFYKQDRLDDLQNTKDAEQQILQDRIDAWDKYLEQLEWDYKEYERLENERILKELMNANSEEEIRARLTADMQKFNSNAQQNYKNYTTIFQDNLLTPYRQANEQLAELRKQRLSLLDTSDFYNKNNNSNNNSYYDEDQINTDDVTPYDKETEDDFDMDKDYAALMLAAKTANKFWEYAELREKKADKQGITLGKDYGIDGAGNKFRYLSNDELYQQWLANQAKSNSSTSSSNKTNSSSSSSNTNKSTTTVIKPSTQTNTNSSSTYGGTDIGQAMLAATTAAQFWKLAEQRTEKIRKAQKEGIDTSKWPTNAELYDQWAKLHPKAALAANNVMPYASGLEEGPVTYTGLAMLHGTPSKPEYVLNNDQAYNLLRNMATTRLPEMKRTGTEDSCGTQYIVQGDVVLEGVNDPAKFWSGVTAAMGSRWNVTRKTKG